MDSVLRPRDIQARIRSGENPDTVAAAAQTTVERIMAFAAPVLAERAFVAQQAQRASVRRRIADGPARHLGEAVADRLAPDVDPESVAWDAWRREDGRWTLVAVYAVGGDPRRASFVFDAVGRYVTAEDDEARWLVGERTATETPPVATPPVEAPPVQRLTPVPVAPEPTPEPEPAPMDALFPADEVEEPAGQGADDTEDTAPVPVRPARPKRRASVPSWDEIMFGSR